MCGGMIESPNSLYRRVPLCTALYRRVPPCTPLYRSTVQLYRSVPLCTAQRYTTEIFGRQNWWAARSLQSPPPPLSLQPWRSGSGPMPKKRKDRGRGPGTPKGRKTKYTTAERRQQNAGTCGSRTRFYSHPLRFR
eukprot:scaffold202931_cov40-Cyclotella_meneghiniana.AAC.1